MQKISENEPVTWEVLCICSRVLLYHLRYIIILLYCLIRYFLSLCGVGFSVYTGFSLTQLSDFLVYREKDIKLVFVL